MTNDDASDELLKSLLAATGPASEDQRLRHMVLDRTLGAVRFRRRIQRCYLVCGLVVCYLAGIGTMTLLRGGLAPDAPETEHVAKDEKLKPATETTLAQISQLQEDRDTKPDAASRSESLRRKADLLFERGDIKSAVRNYKRSLDLASAEQLAIAPGQDTWLLIALKEARTKEMNDDRSATQ